MVTRYGMYGKNHPGQPPALFFVFILMVDDLFSSIEYGVRFRSHCALYKTHHSKKKVRESKTVTAMRCCKNKKYIHNTRHYGANTQFDTRF